MHPVRLLVTALEYREFPNTPTKPRIGKMFTCIASTSRTLKTMIRKLRRSRWFVLLAIVAGAVLAAVDIAPAGGAQSLDAAPVAITDSALSPVTVTIPVGGSVLWTNRGTSSHEVVAERGAFQTFRLAPSNSNRVSFALAGIFPYAVDGKIKGVVIVSAGSAIASPSTSPTGSSAGPDNCGHPTILHYDVRVTVHTDVTRTFPQPGVLHGTQTSVIDWETHWANVAMSVERCRGNLTILIPAGVFVTPAETARQSIAADTKTFNWMDNTTGAENVPPCHFTNVTTARAGMFLQGRLYADSGSDFDFFAARPHEEKAPREPFLEKCNSGGPGDAGLGSNGFDWHTPGYAPVNHLDFAFSPLNIDLHNHVEHRMAFPLAELALGQGFTFNSGELHVTEMNGELATTEWASVSVTPVHQ
jgi:plastocyanin